MATFLVEHAVYGKVVLSKPPQIERPDLPNPSEREFLIKKAKGILSKLKHDGLESIAQQLITMCDDRSQLMAVLQSLDLEKTEVDKIKAEYINPVLNGHDLCN